MEQQHLQTYGDATTIDTHVDEHSHKFWREIAQTLDKNEFFWCVSCKH